MPRPEIAVATVTWARDEREETLLRDALPVLADAGLPACIADGGSSEPFLEFAASLPRVTLVTPRERGLIAQVQASLAGASATGARSILYAESDKRMFFATKLQRFLDTAPRDDDVGVVLAARSARSFATFPPLQRFTEQTLNSLCGEFTGRQGDYSYGPFLVRSDLARHVGTAPKDLGWGWRPYLFALTHRLGYRIVYHVDDYDCPEDQRAEDDSERLHRLRQLAQNVQGLLLGTTCEIEESQRRLRKWPHSCRGGT